MSSRKQQTIKEGFDKFVIKNPEGCWDWRGCCPKNPGYGQFRTMGKMMKAHRASWILNFSEIPKGLFVCHKCDNKRCSNPDHLFLGTCKENNLDAISKGIHPTIGKKRNENHRTKIYEQDFKEILELHHQGFSQKKIGEKFKVSQSSIHKVIKSQVVGY